MFQLFVLCKMLCIYDSFLLLQINVLVFLLSYHILDLRMSLTFVSNISIVLPIHIYIIFLSFLLKVLFR